MEHLNLSYNLKLIIGATFTVLGVGIYCTSLISSIVAGIFHPYQHFYHQGVSDYTSVVQPLITHSQTFDIAATIWLRTTESKELAGTIGGQDLEVAETPLYSDVVFRGLNLSQKNVFSVVNFSLPTAIL